MQEYIYILYDPTFVSQKFYVGKSKYPKRRLQEHLREQNLRQSTFKNTWIKKLLSRKIKPKLYVICQVPINITWQEAETEWITFLKFCGIKLVNSTNGGDGLSHCSQATRNKLSKQKYGFKHTSDARLAITKAQLRLLENGSKYGKLTIIRFAGFTSEKKRRTLYECICECGKTITIRRDSITSGHAKSCGCMIHTAKNKYKYKGIAINKKTKRYTSHISISGKLKYIGTFPSPEEAAKAYDKAALLYYGENAILNFPLK